MLNMVGAAAIEEIEDVTQDLGELAEFCRFCRFSDEALFEISILEIGLLWEPTKLTKPPSSEVAVGFVSFVGSCGCPRLRFSAFVAGRWSIAGASPPRGRADLEIGLLCALTKLTKPATSAGGRRFASKARSFAR
jgi:hypothetical protein